METGVRLIVLAVTALAVLTPAVAAAQSDQGAFVRVDATQCTSQPRRGSGFVWNTANTVVTSLHVVAGCRTVNVRYTVGGGQLRAARLDRALPAADLALLLVDNPVTVRPLTTAFAAPAAGAELTAWGYPIPVRGLIDTTFRRRVTAGRLSDLLNTALVKEILGVGMPDVNAEVVLLDGGHLLPGHSGAPLLDREGRVAAIADGGLERGAVQVSWAIPASRLGELAQSTQRTANVGPRVAELFSAELVTAEETQSFDATVATLRTALPTLSRPSYRCGGAVFVHTRTRMLDELRQTADDIGGLDLLIRSSNGFVQPNDRFDIYQELRSGATVVIPAGAPITTLEGDGICLATVQVNLQVLFHAEAAPTFAEAQNARARFENRMTVRLGTGWQLNPQWTYTTPIVRFDGLTVLRRANNQFGPTGLMRNAFETIATKGGLFMVATALRSGYTPPIVALEQQCFNSRGAMPGCDQAARMLRMSALAHIGVHLSTFPFA